MHILSNAESCFYFYFLLYFQIVINYPLAALETLVNIHESVIV